MRALLLSLLLPLAAAGCSAPPPQPLDIPSGCNPLAAESDCLLPYPSDFFRAPDASLPGGHRVVLSEAAAPRTVSGARFDFTATHPVDGFSTHMPILVSLPGGVSTAGVVFHSDDPAASQRPDSKVLLLDAERAELVPVWAEVDRNTEVPAEQALLIRPFQRLENGRRYVVALQGLAAPDGAPLQAPAGFARLRDGHTAADPALAALAGRYEADIFPLLERVGVRRSGLLLAWDFTTSSAASNTQDLLALRADLLPRLEAAPPRVTISKVIEKSAAENAEIWLRVEGTIQVPLYLEDDQPGARLHRDARGQVAPNGTAEVPFTLQLPQSARPADGSFEPVRILEYGHGFFGLREEINYGFMRGFTQQQRYAAVAVDFWGMSEPDLMQVTRAALAAPATAFDFVDRLHQAMANMIALSYAVRGPLAAAPELRRFGKPLYDPQRRYYYGISQGAIFGVTLLAVNPLLPQAALGVGGGPYSLMMSRSASYAQLYGLLTSVLPDPLTVQKFTALSQSTWDRVDPMSYARHVLREPLPGSPPRRLVFQFGVGDHSVNNLASELLARTLGLPLLTPAPRPVWGLPAAEGPAPQAAVLVDFKLPTLPGVYCRLPTEAEKNDVHEGVRRNRRIQQQLDGLFQPDGLIRNTCEGPCDPE